MTDEKQQAGVTIVLTPELINRTQSAIKQHEQWIQRHESRLSHEFRDHALLADYRLRITKLQAALRTGFLILPAPTTKSESHQP